MTTPEPMQPTIGRACRRDALALAMTRMYLSLAFPPERRRDERGDVPGWVLITVMTAGLVGVIWKLADDQLAKMLQNALSKVKAK